LRLVIADTGPIRYLILIEQIDVIPVLFDKVVLPKTVADELADPETPVRVREWMRTPPAWLGICDVDVAPQNPTLDRLDDGEIAAILLALELNADLILMDDREGVVVARSMGLEVAGTLGVLAMAARRGITDLRSAFDALKRTNFRYRQELLDRLLEDFSGQE
jgi:predicted nucleic acid-binding protein